MKKHLDLLAAHREEMNHLLHFSRLLFSVQQESPLAMNSELVEIFKQREIPLNVYFDHIKSLKVEQLHNSKENIIDSLIHMTCNRILGIENELEKKARVLAYSVLKK